MASVSQPLTHAAYQAPDGQELSHLQAEVMTNNALVSEPQKTIIRITSRQANPRFAAMVRMTLILFFVCGLFPVITLFQLR